MGETEARARGWMRRAILGVIATREAHGFEIVEAIDAELARTAQEPLDRGAAPKGFGEGLVYAALRRLERDGLLCARWVEIGDGVPRRRYYVLTPKGQRVAAAAATPSAATPSAARGARRGSPVATAARP